jgi:hypothetical protein
MRKFAGSTGAVLGLLLIAAVVATGQGVYWESVDMNAPDDPPTKMFYMPGKMRVEMDSKTNAVITRMDQEKMYFLDLGEKTYWTMTYAEFEAQMKEASDQMAQLRDKMKDMPEEQRKMIEKMMGNPATKDPVIVVKKTGERKTVSGYACTRYNVAADGKEMMTMWATTDVKMPPTLREDIARFTKRQMTGNIQFVKAMSEAMMKVDGFVMETDMGSIKTQVTKLELKSSPSAMFEVPAGFKNVPRPAKDAKD